MKNAHVFETCDDAEVPLRIGLLAPPWVPVPPPAYGGTEFVRDPDPKSRTGAIRLIGYSPGAGFVLTMVADPVDWAGLTAWKARGADLRSYLEERR